MSPPPEIKQIACMILDLKKRKKYRCYWDLIQGRPAPLANALPLRHGLLSVLMYKNL